MGVDVESAVQIRRRAAELNGKVVCVEYEGVCETECRALLLSARHLSESQEAALTARLWSDRAVDGRATLMTGSTWSDGHERIREMFWDGRS